MAAQDLQRENVHDNSIVVRSQRGENSVLQIYIPVYKLIYIYIPVSLDDEDASEMILSKEKSKYWYLI